MAALTILTREGSIRRFDGKVYLRFSLLDASVRTPVFEASAPGACSHHTFSWRVVVFASRHRQTPIPPPAAGWESEVKLPIPSAVKSLETCVLRVQVFNEADTDEKWVDVVGFVVV